jgi:hypothetical protein
MSAAVGIPGSSVLLIPVVPRPMRSIQSTRHPTKYNPRYSTLSILAARNQTPFDTLFSDAAPAVWLHERTLFAAELRCESFPKEVTMESALAPSLRIGKTNLLRIFRVLCLRENRLPVKTKQFSGTPTMCSAPNVQKQGRIIAEGCDPGVSCD